MSARLSIAFATLVFALVAPVIPVTAQVINSEISGSVADESGAVLPGATIVGRNVQTGFERNVVSDERGHYRLLALPAGQYDVRVELPGFATEVRERLTLTINQSVTLNFTMKVAALAETLTVAAEAPLVQTTRAELGKTIETKTIDSLPLNGRNFVQLATLVPGVRQSGTGLSMGGQSFGLQENNHYSVDGVDNNNDVNGGTWAPYSQDAIREFQVITNQFSAEFGKAGGGVVNILTRSGTNDVQARAYYFLRDESMDATNAFAQRNAPFRRQQFGGTLGGPVIRDKMHYFGSVERVAEDRVASIVTPGLQADFPQPTRQTTAFGKINHQITDKHTFESSINWAKRSQTAVNIGGRVLPTNGRDELSRQFIFVAGLTSALSSTRLNELRFSVQASKGDRIPADPVGPEISRPSTIEGRCNACPANSNNKRYQIVESFTQNFDWAGNHALKAGADISAWVGDSLVATFFGGQFVFTTDRPFDANDLTTYPSQYTLRTGQPLLHTVQDWYGMYVRDNWQVHPRLTLNVGMRYDVAPHVQDNTIKADTNNVAPRLAFTWTPTDSKSLVVRGGYGRYFDQFYINTVYNIIRFGAQPPLGRGITRTIVLTNPGYPDPFSRQTSPALEDVALSDGEEQTPYSDQVSFGLSRQLGSSMAFSADWVRVRGHHITRNFDFNALDPSTGRRPQPQFGKMYSFQTSGHSWYDALQMSFEKRFSRRYQYLVSYTLSQAEDDWWHPYTNIAGAAPQSYFNLDAEKGYSDSDERHHAVISGVVELPAGIRLGAILNARSARPFNITTGRDNNSDGNFTDRPNLVANASGNARFVDPGLGFSVQGNLPRNFGRGASFASLDMRVSKVLNISGANIELLAEAFNLTNRVNYSTFQGNLRSALFYRPIAATDPRQIQIGARIDF